MRRSARSTASLMRPGFVRRSIAGSMSSVRFTRLRPNLAPSFARSPGRKGYRPRSGGDRLSSRDRADDAQRRIRVVFAGRRLGYGRGLGRSRSAALPEQLARHQYDFDERSALVKVIA